MKFKNDQNFKHMFLFLWVSILLFKYDIIQGRLIRKNFLETDKKIKILENITNVFKNTIVCE